MEVIRIDVIDEYVRITVRLNSRDSTVLSSLIGSDICSAQSRFIDISLIEKNLTPNNIFRSRVVNSSECIAVLNIPSVYLEILIKNSSGLPKLEILKNYISFLTNYLDKIYEILVSKGI